MPKRHCKFFARGACTKGDQCEYSHDRKNPSINICRFYQKGTCAFGGQCKYKHIQTSQAQSLEHGSQLLNFDRHGKSIKLEHQDYQKNYDASEPSTALPSRKKCSCVPGELCVYCKKFCLYHSEPNEKEEHLQICGKKEKYLEVLNKSQEIECRICYERVLSKPKADECKFGIPSACNHPFCLSCIRNWRSSSPTSFIKLPANRNVKTCPICRKLSYYVIPSTVWYFTMEEKQEIIGNYKTSCKLINCKHFDLGNGYCPFRNNCFYRHTVKPGSYTWIHHKPPPAPPRSYLDLPSQEFPPNLELFNEMYPSEIRGLPGTLVNSMQFDADTSNDETDPSFGLAAMSEVLDSNSDAIDSEDLNLFEIMPLTHQGPDGSWWFGIEGFDDQAMGVVPSVAGQGGSSLSVPDMPPSETLGSSSGHEDPKVSNNEEQNPAEPS
ncbi:E3 ubiquitin-protein ligase makorin-like [Neltuma alba]|uniref:E3 ubiquitin-protein ligase makorin-like n=1 Tax=Neltuma alba TaxID=207710 RepID=UPI0010A4CAD8|nr:E3 ubiquitin-protein ligase makorin-like [Prosopis alba]